MNFNDNDSAYIRRHHLPSLYNEMVLHLVRHMPEDPIQGLIEYLASEFNLPTTTTTSLPARRLSAQLVEAHQQLQQVKTGPHDLHARPVSSKAQAHGEDSLAVSSVVPAVGSSHSHQGVGGPSSRAPQPAGRSTSPSPALKPSGGPAKETTPQVSSGELTKSSTASKATVKFSFGPDQDDATDGKEAFSRMQSCPAMMNRRATPHHPVSFTLSSIPGIPALPEPRRSSLDSSPKLGSGSGLIDATGRARQKELFAELFSLLDTRHTGRLQRKAVEEILQVAGESLGQDKLARKRVMRVLAMLRGYQEGEELMCVAEFSRTMMMLSDGLTPSRFAATYHRLRDHAKGNLVKSPRLSKLWVLLKGWDSQREGAIRLQNLESVVADTDVFRNKKTVRKRWLRWRSQHFPTFVSMSFSGNFSASMVASASFEDSAPGPATPQPSMNIPAPMLSKPSRSSSQATGSSVDDVVVSATAFAEFIRSIDELINDDEFDLLVSAVQCQMLDFAGDSLYIARATPNNNAQGLSSSSSLELTEEPPLTSVLWNLDSPLPSSISALTKRNLLAPILNWVIPLTDKATERRISLWGEVFDGFDLDGTAYIPFEIVHECLESVPESDYSKAEQTLWKEVVAEIQKSNSKKGNARGGNEEEEEDGQEGPTISRDDFILLMHYLSARREGFEFTAFYEAIHDKMESLGTVGMSSETVARKRALRKVFWLWDRQNLRTVSWRFLNRAIPELSLYKADKNVRQAFAFCSDKMQSVLSECETKGSISLVQFQQFLLEVFQTVTDHEFSSAVRELGAMSPPPPPPAAATGSSKP